jgi:hypothetical protein
MVCHVRHDDNGDRTRRNGQLMKKYMVQVTESIHHCYLIEADDHADAMERYYELSDDDLTALDLDGSAGWDKPWDVAEVEGDK